MLLFWLRFTPVLLLTTQLQSAVQLPKLFSDNMVLQRDRPLHVWGTASPGEAISIGFAGNSVRTEADDLGSWSAYLPARPAGGPFELSVAGQNQITLKNVLIGDVWIASGQSNMEFKLRQGDNAEKEVAAAQHPTMRFLRVERRTAIYPQEDVESSGWQLCEPNKAPEFSAVAYFFARDLQERIHVPIGIIDNSWGGTPLAAFTSMTALGHDAALMPQFAAWGAMMQDEAKILRQAEKEKRDLQAAKEQAATAGKPAPAGKWHPVPESWSPAGIFNAMVAPLTPAAIAGVIWYQGESDGNRERAGNYAALFRAMITDWRAQWQVGDFPFLFVQLPNYIAEGKDSAWPELREAQLQTLQVKNTGMAITLDLGDPTNIHPTHKQEVGRRLSLLARAQVLNEAVEDEGPLLRSAQREGATVRLSFDHAGGLTAKGGDLQCFELAGHDGKFVRAQATIDGQILIVSASSIDRPEFVRYAWNDNPTTANLMNSDGLPASPFRSPVQP